LPSTWDLTRCMSALRARTRFSESLTWWSVRARISRSMPLDRILRCMTVSARSRFPFLTSTTIPRTCCTCPRRHASIDDRGAASTSPRTARANDSMMPTFPLLPQRPPPALAAGRDSPLPSVSFSGGLALGPNQWEAQMFDLPPTSNWAPKVNFSPHYTQKPKRPAPRIASSS
jgi:hypothetical protein